MVVPTFQDAEIILRLYDQFESERIREARRWFSKEVNEESCERFLETFPAGSDGFMHFQTLYGFFEMVGVLYKNRLVHPDLLFDMWYINGIFSKLYPIIAKIRANGDPHVAENFESLALAELEWIGKVKGTEYVPELPYAK